MACGVATGDHRAVIVIARGEGIGQLRDAFFAVIVVVVGIALSWTDLGAHRRGAFRGTP
jgi:hypothetical protein